MPRPPKVKPKPLPQTEMPIGKRIAHLRKLRGFSQASLAETIGVSRKQITDYETGKAHLNDEMIIRLALALKVQTDVLLGVKTLQQKEDPPTLRFTRRLRELTQLSDAKKRMVLKVIDDLIRANS